MFDWETVVARTGIKNKERRKLRLEKLCEWYREVEVEGLVAECGTWRGASAMALCMLGAKVHCFDSFEGFADGPGDFKIDIEVVRKNLDGFDVVLNQGWIPEVFSHAPDGPYKFVHVDVDKYQATKDSFAFFIPRLCVGGSIVCDDYNWINEAQKAVDELVLFEISGTQAIYRRVS